MSFFFGDILCDFKNSAKVNPNKSNSSTYASEVQAWLQKKTVDLGLWNV